MPRSLTSANSVFILTVPGVFPAPVQIQGYSADDQFTADAVDVAETSMGVDGKMSAGFVPFITPINITLQADSESADLFELWLGAQQTIREIIFGEAVITIPGIGKTYACHKGVLKQVKLFPDGKKTLQPVSYQLHWESVVAAPIELPVP